MSHARLREKWNRFADLPPIVGIRLALPKSTIYAVYMVGRPIPMRLDDSIVERLDKLASLMSERTGGVEISRASVLRVALERGIDSLEKELGAPTPKKKKS